MQELAEEWKVTPHSEDELNKLSNTFPDWPDLAPWKTIRLNKDETSQVKLEIPWLPDYTNSQVPHENTPEDVLTNNILDCSWKTAAIGGVTEQPNTDVRGALILWNFIGDPDDFVPQDFIKVQN